MTGSRLGAIRIALSAAALASSIVAEAADTDLAALRALDAQVVAVGHRLVGANAARCARTVALAGLALHDVSQYAPRARAKAERLFGFGEAPAVLAIAPTSAGYAAGLRADDLLLAVGGVPIERVERAGGRASNELSMRVLGALQAAAAAGPFSLTIERGGIPHELLVAPERACGDRIELVPATRLSARADGATIQVSSAMAAFAGDPDSLAVVLAHELAHSILGHETRRRAAKRVRADEIEADALSLTLMTDAGFDPHAAARFWTRYGAAEGRRRAASTHPGWRDRAAFLAAEAARLSGQRAAAPQRP